MRFVLVIGCLSLAFLTLGARLFQHQVLDHAKHASVAHGMHRAKERIPTYRGDIELSDGPLVARDVMSFEVGLDPRQVGADKLPQCVRTVCDAVGETDDYRRARLLVALNAREAANTAYVRLARRASAEGVAAIREAFSRFLSPRERRCLVVRKENRRSYPRSTFLSSVVGVTNEAGEGIEGVELSMNAYLSPREGLRELLKDASRRQTKFFQLDNYYLPPAAAYDVTLTIDSRTQAIAEAALERGVKEDKADSGLIVVMDCNTGAIRAMASYPTYDPNRYRDYPKSERQRRRRNAVIESLYEPGSVLKPFVFHEVLERKLCSRQQLVKSLAPEAVKWDGGDMARFGSRIVRDTHSEENMKVEDALVLSSNIGMAILGLRLGRDGLLDVIRQFGFCEPTAIDLPAEAKGKHTDPSAWKALYSSVSVSFGYEILISPMQLCRAFAALVNGGYLLKPRIVERLTCGDRVYEFPQRQVVGRPLSEALSAEMREVLREVVRRGTGRFLKLEGFDFGGKSGTARMLEGGGYNRQDYLASFEAFVPYDEPEVVILCMVEKPRSRRYYGSWVAGPIVVDVIRQLYGVSAVPPVRKYKDRGD